MKLVVENGPNAGNEYGLVEGVNGIGRAGGNRIVLRDSGVSRHHAEIEGRGDQLLLRDLGSTNGTFLNGQRVSAARELRPGDRLRLGDTTLRVSAEPARSSAVPAVARPRAGRGGGASLLPFAGLAVLIVISVVILSHACGGSGPGPPRVVVVPPTEPPLPKLNVSILGCNTGFDIIHGMGEVTNAYVEVSNVGTGEATGVRIVLSGEDEGRAHPDRTKTVGHLPPGYQVTEKLTIDTAFRADTSIRVDVSASGNVSEHMRRDSCREIDPDVLGRLQGLFGIVRLLGIP